MERPSGSVRQHPSEPRRRFDHATPAGAAAAASRPAPEKASPARADASRRPGKREFRADIQGLRAIAVLLVLVYHLWPDTLTGGFVGVDVFFVISGFLITAHLLQHPPTGGRDLLAFWGRRIRRLLPAAFLVLAVTAIASLLVAPDTRWANNAGQMIASALYVQNWVLAANSVDYLAAADPPTPVQHYWSLSVEEQFYLFWPILILAIFWLVRRSRIGPALATRIAMLAVIAVSLYISITATADDPASAYFITPTRVWELAAGGLVATLPALGSLQIAGRIVDAVAWLALVMLLLAGVVINATTPFPGSAALLPVAGTALVILAAAEGRRSPTRWLAVRPIQHLGDTSYSIYLWHWPLIVLWPYAFGEISALGAAAIIALTIGLSTLSKVFVEDAFRFAPAFQPLVPTFRFAAAGMVLLTVFGSGQLIVAQQRLDAALASDPAAALGSDDGTPEPPSDGTPVPGAGGSPGSPGVATPGAGGGSPNPTVALTSCVGAASIIRGFDACPQDPAGTMVPSPVAAATDVSAAYRDGCWIYAPFASHTTCTYGKGSIRIALVGNSHAGQWLPALQVLAKKDGWTITTFLASQCNATDASLEFYSSTKSQGCLAYGNWVMNQTKGDAFDLVVTSERQSVTTLGNSWGQTWATARQGYTSYLTDWSQAGTKVLVLQDTPYPGRTLQSVPDCLAQHPRNQPACGGTPDGWNWGDPQYDAAVALNLPGITPVATHQFLCTDSVCPAVIGGVVAYFDASHMTATYSRTIAPFLEPEILAALAAQ
ncbi:MAG TPA: acyltransferase family protein [Candidatus Limnocylindrales bacterium]|nr:acyltransferase family protein [Candidatus Limnocylindrales bacterium]